MGNFTRLSILVISIIFFCTSNVNLLTYPNNAPVWVAYYPIGNSSVYNPGQINHSQLNNSYYPSNQSHNLIMGFPSLSDKLVVDTIIKGEPFTRWGKSVKTFKFPPHGIVNRQNITAIHVFDQISNGTGGWPYVIEGGIGSQNCTIKLKSRSGQAMSFRIRVYTKN